MKKHLIFLLAVILTVSMLFMGIGCKEQEEAEPVEEEAAEEEAPAEEAEESVEEAEEKPFDGVTVKALMYDFPNYEPIYKYIPEIEEELGIKFEVEKVPGTTYQDKMWLDLTSGAGEYDIIYLSPSWKGKAVEEGLIISLNEYMEKYEVDLDGFLKGAVDMGRYGSGDELWGYPFILESWFLQYRKDLFTDPENQANFKELYGYDLEPPTNPSTDEFLDYAEFFTDHSDDVDYGFFWYMGSELWSWIWMHHVLPSFGVEWWDEDYQSTINTPLAIEALEWAMELQEFIPEEALQSDQTIGAAPLYEGQVAIMPVVQARAIEGLNPEMSEFSDDWGYCLVPHGPDQEYGKFILGGGALAISKYSKNPEAAFALLNYIFSDDERAAEMASSGGPMNRVSVYSDEEVIGTFPEGSKVILDIHVEASNTTSFDRITVPVAAEIYQEQAIMWGNIVTGTESIEVALEKANKNIDAILQEWVESK